MSDRKLRIGVVAPGGRIEPDVAERVKSFAADAFLDAAPEIVFHPQCFMSAGHFAGDDAVRAQAFVEFANDPAFGAVWFARGGYGACRMAEPALAALAPAARTKGYLGYSDAGAVLAGLYRAGFENVAHGPMPVDITREGGEAAVKRALGWLIERSPESLELTVASDVKTAAFNIMILASVLGTPLEPDLGDHVIMLEDVGEYLYRIDRVMFQITHAPGVRRAKGIKLGRISAITQNDPPFGADEEEIVKHWCKRAGIAYLGRADIGHDVENKVVPFGALKS